MQIVDIYTDGACSNNPGPGGWGVYFCYGENEKCLSGGVEETTNNRMEMQAVIEALKTLSRPCQVNLYTDSKYVMQGINEWVPRWQANGWRTAAKKSVKNKDLWLTLLENLERHEVEWHWVKGHSGNPGNERADELATSAIKTLVLGKS